MGEMLSFYPISVTEQNFVKISIGTSTYCENTSYVTILSTYVNITRFYTKFSNFAFFQMSKSMADIYERVHIHIHIHTYVHHLCVPTLIV